jgi:hypothetical protein
MVVGSRFMRLRQYVERELASTLRDRDPSVLAKTRLTLWEEVAPMSLHIGLVRVSLATESMMDMLFDTSDSDRNLQPTACVAFPTGRFPGCLAGGKALWRRDRPWRARRLVTISTTSIS